MAAPGIVIVYALFGDTDSAKAAAREVVSEGLAACANILAPCTSIYEWRGAVETADETPVLFKTRADRRPALMARLAEMHGYEVPAILSWDVAAAHAPYAEWVRARTEEKR